MPDKRTKLLALFDILHSLQHAYSFIGALLCTALLSMILVVGLLFLNLETNAGSLPPLLEMSDFELLLHYIWSWLLA